MGSPGRPWQGQAQTVLVATPRSELVLHWQGHALPWHYRCYDRNSTGHHYHGLASRMLAILDGSRRECRVRYFMAGTAPRVQCSAGWPTLLLLGARPLLA